MTTLLWRDFRQYRKVLCITACFVLVPYAVALLWIPFGLLREQNSGRFLEGTLLGSSAWGLAMAVLMCSMIAGNAIAGERADRSAEFSAYLPISRRRAIQSKAIVTLSSCLSLWMFNLLVGLFGLLMIWLRGDGSEFPYRGFGDFLVTTAGTSVLFLGVAWLVSSFAKSPVIAAASGIAAGLILFGLLRTLQSSFFSDEAYWESITKLFVTLSTLTGVLSFVAGFVCYLRRVEP